MQNKASPYAQPISHSFPTPRTYEGKLYYGAVDVAKIVGVEKRTVTYWHERGLFLADARAHDGRYLYEVERVLQLKSVYHPNWMRGGYEPSPTTSAPEPDSHPSNLQMPKGQFNKISAATIEAINRLSPDALEAHGIIQRARVSGYVCPTCGSGEGSHGTGMTLNKKNETNSSFHCFSCGGNFNVFRLCALHYGLDIRADYPKLIEKICADFDIPLTYDEFSFIGGRRVAGKIAKRTDTVSPEELKCIQDDFNASVEPLKTFMKYQPDQKWRGFDFEFLANHGYRLINNWTHPKTRNTNKQELTPTMRMIVPAGDVSYLARLVDQPRNYDIKARPFIHEKVHAGRKVLFNPEALNSDEPVFCFEGFFDALSAEIAGFKAVALGGRGEGDLLLAAIDQLKHKPQIIIVVIK